MKSKANAKVTIESHMDTLWNTPVYIYMCNIMNKSIVSNWFYLVTNMAVNANSDLQY
jgi:hypothetical protein